MSSPLSSSGPPRPVLPERIARMLDESVERLMIYLQAENERLAAELTAKDTQIAQLTQALSDERARCQATYRGQAEQVAQLTRERELYENAQCVTCQRHLDCADELAQALGPSVEEKEQP